MLLAGFSAWLQGFEFGIDNNTFHIPIVLRWYDLPQFAQDAVIQSLRRYATPVFPFLGLFSDERNIQGVFFAAFLLTRALTITAMLQVMKACGLRGVWLAAAISMSVFISAIYGESLIGRDELLIDFFTHTTLAQAVALLGIASLIRGNLLMASLATGIAFDINAMVGIWELVPLALSCLYRLATAPRTQSAEILKAVTGFAATALPVGLWIAMSQHFSPADFDYRSYLSAYYPYHFFIGWARWHERIIFALQLMSGILALTLLPRNRGGAAVAYFGFVLVFCAGILVGQLSHSRFLLNLHLLRADGMALLVGVPLIVAAAFSALATLRPGMVGGGLAVLVGLVAGDWRIVVAGMILLSLVQLSACTSDTARQRLTHAFMGKAVIVAIIAAATLATAIAYGDYSGPPAPPGRNAVPTDAQLAGASPRAPEWLQVTRWARSGTPPDSLFLVPPKLDFVAAAQRRSWVGWKEGAAAMWAPETYAGWKSRSDEVASLRSIEAELAYACSHGINFIIQDKRPGHALAGPIAVEKPVFENHWFAILASSNCRHSGP